MEFAEKFHFRIFLFKFSFNNPKCIVIFYLLQRTLFSLKIEMFEQKF